MNDLVITNTGIAIVTTALIFMIIIVILMIRLEYRNNSIKSDIFRWAHDCDGMCNHCSVELKAKCKEIK